MKHPEALREYCRLVLASPVSVTAVDEPDAAWRLLVEDALTAVDLIAARAPGSLVDVGSGGGSPGIPIAIETEIPTVLLEARERKSEFLRATVEQLQLDCEVVTARSEDHAGGSAREGYDMALARALAPPPVALELCLPLVRPGGWLVLWTAAIDAQELQPVAEILGGSFADTVTVSEQPSTAGGGQDPAHPPAVPAAPRRGRETSARLATIGSMNGRVYALANQKGGVGKTTTAINMAACVAEAGTPVLLIDLDPQANATTGLGFRPDQLDCSTYDLLHGRPLADVVVSTSIPNLDLAPSHPDLAAAQVELPKRHDHGTLLRDILADTEERYPYVFVDCPPSLGLLTVNALSAANRLIVPVQCEYYALEGLAQLLQSVELVRTKLNPRLGVTGVLLTMYDGRTRLSSDVADEVRSYFGDLVFETVVPRSVRLAEAPSHGVPITRYDARSAGADAYFRAAMEVVERG